MLGDFWYFWKRWPNIFVQIYLSRIKGRLWFKIIGLVYLLPIGSKWARVSKIWRSPKPSYPEDPKQLNRKQLLSEQLLSTSGYTKTSLKQSAFLGYPSNSQPTSTTHLVPKSNASLAVFFKHLTVLVDSAIQSRVAQLSWESFLIPNYYTSN